MTIKANRKNAAQDPLTEELLVELLSMPSTDAAADAVPATAPTLDQYLNELLAAKNLRRADVITAASLNNTFGYQIFTGARNASRNNLLRLAFAMDLTLKETERLLQAGGANVLYCKNRRDAIILFCRDNGYELRQTDEELYRFGEDTICQAT